MKIGTEIRFIRYGRPPMSGRSTNFATGEAEAGVSVYGLTADGVATSVIRAEFADRKLVFVGLGVVVGYGSDGEPLVSITSIRRATEAQEERAYYGMSRSAYMSLHNIGD